MFFFFLSLLLQCKFANATLLPLLSFSYFITLYDAQASSAFSALILLVLDTQVVLCIAFSLYNMSAQYVCFRIIESMMGLRPRLGNPRLVFRLFSLMRGLPSIRRK